MNKQTELALKHLDYADSLLDARMYAQAQDEIQACKEALEQVDKCPYRMWRCDMQHQCAHPPSWQGLNIDDRNKIFNKFGVYAVPANFELFRAIEQALKEKNHG